MVKKKNKKVEKVRFQFDPNIELDFEGGQISSDTGLLLYRKFEEKMGLMDLWLKKISVSKDPVARILTLTVFANRYIFFWETMKITTMPNTPRKPNNEENI